MQELGLLGQVAVYLAAAVITVPISKRLGLGSVLGYLAAGVAIGPWALGLIAEARDILHFAEFGVVLLLFLIGLELNPNRLWAMRRAIFGLGGAQVALSTLLLYVLFRELGMEWRWALVGAMGVALSSTAIALQTLTERNLLSTPAGRSGFAVLLFQDIAVIPMLMVIPLLGGGGGETVDAWVRVAKILAAIGLVVVGGRFLVLPLLRLIAQSGVREIFTASALLLVIVIGLMMEAFDLSMALGAFLTGVLLAESEYRHALESDIEPFKGLLLGLFFIAVGMSLDFGVLLGQPLQVLQLLGALLLAKALVLWLLAWIHRIPLRQHLLFVCLLAQGGEFAFVLFAAGVDSGVLDGEWRDLLIGAVVLSMALTPLLLFAVGRWFDPLLTGRDRRPMDTITEPEQPVIIVGFGRFGQIVGRLLHANGIDTTILDHDPQHIDLIRRFGFKVFYGDGNRLDLLEAAGAARAKLLVLAIDDQAETVRIAGLVRERFPQLRILARAWDARHVLELREAGVDLVERETFEGALRLGETALRQLGLTAWRANQAAHQFRRHDVDLVELQFRHFHEEIEVRGRISADAREQLREQMQIDVETFAVHRDSAWDPDEAGARSDAEGGERGGS
ncbi:MAG: glutathione-regulated potassium-efflux system protein KefC [Gammaproteobacteria bacterium]|nr:glutathione-regulated potassium-efflux system protein KefC [Gammaproteobacteria bacterium]